MHPLRGSQTAALALLCVAQFIDVLGVTVAVVALPSIARDLEAGSSAGHWVVSAYALSFGLLLLPFGRIADRVGRRRLFTAGLVAFAASSLACGLAISTPMLLAARTAQGAAAAAVVPAALALLAAAFAHEPERTRALAVWTAAAAGGGAAGFLVGGLVTDALGWRWVFLVNVPVAIAAAALAPLLLAESRGPRHRRHAPLRVLRRAAIAGPAAVACLLTATTSGAAVLVTAHLQDVLGRSPAATGAAFLPFSVLVAAGSLAGPRLVARIGRRGAIVSGLAAIAIGMLVFTRATAGSGTAAIVAGLAISGAGLGWASVATTAIGMAAAGAADRGLVAGILNTATQIGTAAGVAVLGAVAAAATAGHDARSAAALVAGHRAGWVAAAAGAAAAGILMRRGGTIGACPSACTSRTPTRPTS